MASRFAVASASLCPPDRKTIPGSSADLLLLRPSQDLGALAGRYEPMLSKVFRFLTRGLGSREDKGSDLISMLMFQRDYIERLIEIGAADGDARSQELERILSTES